MLVTYDITKKPGDRVVDVLVRCTDCRVPEYLPLDEDKFYKIVTTSFLARGGGGFDVFREHGRDHFTGIYTLFYALYCNLSFWRT